MVDIPWPPRGIYSSSWLRCSLEGRTVLGPFEVASLAFYISLFYFETIPSERHIQFTVIDLILHIFNVADTQRISIRIESQCALNFDIEWIFDMF